MYVVVESLVFIRFHSPDESYVAPSGATYPPSSIANMAAPDREAIGLYVLHDGTRPDDTEYDVAEGTPALEGGVWTRQYSSTPKDPDSLRQRYIDAVNAQAEVQRLQYITGGAGQQLLYRIKERHAREVLTLYTGGEDVPPAGAYPLLEASVGKEIYSATTEPCIDVMEAAYLVAERADQVDAAIIAIEEKRIIAKTAIREATTIAQMKAAIVIDWAMSSIPASASLSSSGTMTA